MYRNGNNSSSFIKGLAITLVAATLLGGGYHMHKNNPFNNKNIKFINHEENDYSPSTMELFKNYNRFENLMGDCINNNWGNLKESDIDELAHYLDIIATSNFKDYDDKLMYELDKSGFFVFLENYFPHLSNDKTLVSLFSGYYQKLINKTYHNSTDAVDKLVEECSSLYHTFGDKISDLSPIARLTIYKIMRPIIDTNGDYYCRIYNKQKSLNDIDNGINECIREMKGICSAYKYR